MPSGIFSEPAGSGELDALIREYIREAEANSEEGVVIVPDVPVSGTLSYERFRELMDQVNRLIGGHSAYDPEYLEHSTRVPQTYEGALEEYSAIVEKDRYTGAFARIFCDYMGLLLSLLPVFLAVARILKDKRAQASQVIWSKRASSSCIILSRYLAALAMTMLPVILTAACCHFRCASAAAAAGIPADQLAFVKYIAGWLLPGAAFTLAAGFLISELTEGIWAVLFHGLFWFYSIFQSFTGLNGNFGLKFVPRFNSFGNTELFFSQLSDLIVNRIVYLALAVLLIMLCVPVYSWNGNAVSECAGIGEDAGDVRGSFRDPVPDARVSSGSG